MICALDLGFKKLKKTHYTFLATKPSNTFLKAMEKVLEGLVKNGGILLIYLLQGDSSPKRYCDW